MKEISHIEDTEALAIYLAWRAANSKEGIDVSDFCQLGAQQKRIWGKTADMFPFYLNQLNEED